jgi:hypothetical protein
LLADLVLDNAVPLFLAHNYGRFPDYAGGTSQAIGANCIALQRRSGIEWPTVEFQFSRRCRPFVNVIFAWLPEQCQRWSAEAGEFVRIPRIEANVVEGPAFFSLCKGRKWSNDCSFGDTSIFFHTIWLRQKLQNEAAELRTLCEWLVELLDQRPPLEWLQRDSGGPVHRNVQLNWGSYLLRERRRNMNTSPRSTNLCCAG